MTCIVGLVDNGAVYIGGDSCGSNRHSYDTVHTKVFNVGEHLIGVCGSFRGTDLLRYELNVNDPREGEDPERYIRRAFLGAVRSAFKSGGLLKDDHGQLSHPAPFLVAWRGALWTVQGDLSVITTPEWGAAIGSGDESARGSLHSTLGLVKAPAERVRKALEAAEAVVTTVRGPHRVWRLNDCLVEEVTP